MNGSGDLRTLLRNMRNGRAAEFARRFRPDPQGRDADEHHNHDETLCPGRDCDEGPYPPADEEESEDDGAGWLPLDQVGYEFFGDGYVRHWTPGMLRDCDEPFPGRPR